jgi:hypothetical protein
MTPIVWALSVVVATFLGFIALTLLVALFAKGARAKRAQVILSDLLQLIKDLCKLLADLLRPPGNGAL